MKKNASRLDSILGGLGIAAINAGAMEGLNRMGTPATYDEINAMAKQMGVEGTPWRRVEKKNILGTSGPGSHYNFINNDIGIRRGATLTEAAHEFGHNQQAKDLGRLTGSSSSAKKVMSGSKNLSTLGNMAGIGMGSSEKTRRYAGKTGFISSVPNLVSEGDATRRALTNVAKTHGVGRAAREAVPMGLAFGTYALQAAYPSLNAKLMDVSKDSGSGAAAKKVFSGISRLIRK
jgi:hypothetical protein